MIRPETLLDHLREYSSKDIEDALRRSADLCAAVREYVSVLNPPSSTIDELERILKEDDTLVTINPDGSITPHAAKGELGNKSLGLRAV